jgi:hypothetical protein
MLRQDERELDQKMARSAAVSSLTDPNTGVRTKSQSGWNPLVRCSPSNVNPAQWETFLAMP